jgi:hypothetical protein
LLALFKAQPKDLAVGDAAAEGVEGDATLAQISATVRLLKREVQLAWRLSQALRSSGPWKSRRATKRVSSALRESAWMRACWLGVREPQRCSSKRREMPTASV